MTDTDDTDDLLLIPPDFFVIDSEDSEHPNNTKPYYSIVDSLIKQVSNLQKRIKSIESTESILGNSLEYTFDKSQTMQNSNDFRKCNSSENLFVPKSAPSTPQKQHAKYKVNSLPNSPNIDRYSPRKNTSSKTRFTTPASPPKSTKTDQNTSIEGDGRMLQEIDTFLSKVKTIQRINTVKNLNQDFNSCSSHRSDDFHPVLYELGRQEPINQSKHDPLNRDLIVKEKTWQSGDYKDSVPDYGAGVRETLYSTKENKMDDTTNSLNKNEFSVNLEQYCASDSSSDSTQVTAYKKNREGLLNNPLHSHALNILSMHKQLLSDSDKKPNVKGKYREHKLKSTNTINDNLGLLSLADIWSTKSQVLNLNQSQLVQKFQEEKLRRQHCEDLIQELQNRNLELQQKLSVAVKVDDSKNAALLQFQEALEKIMIRMDKLTKEKRDWENQITKLKDNHSNEMDKAQKKISYYEAEASKALNLAHGNQEKSSCLEKTCVELQHQIDDFQKRYKVLQDNYEVEIERNKQLSSLLSQQELEVNENKNALNSARLEVAQSRKAVELCQAEFTDMKKEHSKLQEDLGNQIEEIVKLNELRKSLLDKIEEHKKRESNLQEELNKTKKQLENLKLELRNFYQGQVEILVQNKLKEFQNQLDQAEVTFKEEVKKREMSIAKTAANHIHQISDKFTLEIKLLEKKHQEELKLHEIKQVQYKQQVDHLQGELDRLQEKRMNVAKQLQKIMESQWTEALKIITSSKSPPLDEHHFSTIDQLNSLKSRSYSNLEELLSQPQEQYAKFSRKHEIQSLQNTDNAFVVGNNDKKERDMCDLPVETPVSSRSQAAKQFTDNEIQKYISLLLSKPQRLDSHQDEAVRSVQDGDKTTWPHDQELTNRAHVKPSYREKVLHKPPWK